MMMNKDMTDLQIESSADFKEFLDSNLDLGEKETLVIKTSNKINLDHLPIDANSILINLKTVNNIQDINDFLCSVNHTLPENGIYICFVETYPQRRQRIRTKHNNFFVPFYLLLDFIFKRVFPKLKLTRKIYNFISADCNRALSLTETLGRLVYCGFGIVEVKEINNLYCIIAQKKRQPNNGPEPSTGLILKMPRSGLDGKEIIVYKLRTMHPYAQYIQDYIYQKNSLQAGGKICNDFRVADWGQVIRRLMLDEFPMLFNVLKGDIKLFGIRPLSSQYLSLYPESLQERRKTYQPGFLPPYHADKPTSFDEIIESEIKYLDAYDQKPLQTDTRYFFRALYNIFFKGASSSK